MSRRLRIITSTEALQSPLLDDGDLGSLDPDARAAARAAEFESAEARGYARGLEAGKKRTEAELEVRIEGMSASLTALTDAFDAAREEVEGQAVDAALRSGIEIARRILEREVAVNPDVVMQSVESALARLPGAGDIEVRVHPEDVATLQESGLLRDAMDGGRLQFVADESVDRGGCVVRSDAGLVDARLRAQLKNAAEHLFAGLAEEVQETS